MLIDKNNYKLKFHFFILFICILNNNFEFKNSDKMAEGSNKISFEEAMNTLVAMFPSWERDALTQILIQKNG